MTLENYFSKHSSVLWYPSCGPDLRICHHILTNNVYLSPDLIIANDSSNWDTHLVDELARVNGASVAQEEIIQISSFLNSQAVLREVTFIKEDLTLKKTVLHLWNIENSMLMDYLEQKRLRVDAIFCKRMRGDSLLETNLNAALDILNTRFFISDLNHLRNGDYDFLMAENFAKHNRLILRSHCDYYRSPGQIPEYVFCFERP